VHEGAVRVGGGVAADAADESLALGGRFDRLREGRQELGVAPVDVAVAVEIVEIVAVKAGI